MMPANIHHTRTCIVFRPLTNSEHVVQSLLRPSKQFSKFVKLLHLPSVALTSFPIMISNQTHFTISSISQTWPSFDQGPDCTVVDWVNLLPLSPLSASDLIQDSHDHEKLLSAMADRVNGEAS